MKRKRNKFKAVVAIALSMALILGACGSQSAGAGASKDMIPLSEVLFSGNDIVILADDRIDESGKDSSVMARLLKADGTVSQLMGAYGENNLLLGDVAQMSDEELISLDWATVGADIDPVEWKYRGQISSRDIVTDATGNDTQCIKVVYGTDSDWKMSDLTFASFVGHITIYDTSYMRFRQNYGSYTGSPDILIRDTKDTIDKTVYLDAPGTEGFTVDGK